MNERKLQVVGGRVPERSQEHTLLADLYARYGGQVFGRCRYLLGDAAEAEDATQEVFAKAFCNLDGFRAEASSLTWLMKIATHHCLNVLRASQALWKDEVRKMALVKPTSDDATDQRALVRSLLGRFDLETQACAIHYLVDEMSQEEVALLVGLSVPTVRKRVRTFLDAARAALGAEEHAS